MYGCKLRYFLSLQPLSLFYSFGTNQYNFGTSQKISAFERFELHKTIYIKHVYLFSGYKKHKNDVFRLLQIVDPEVNIETEGLV